MNKNFVLTVGLGMSCICLLSACSGSAPQDSQILEDLQSEVVNYKEFLSVEEFEVEQSKTEKDTYSATLKVKASSTYADFDMRADVEYLKYDQGWDITECDWTEQGYTVVSYPDETEMTSIVNSDEKMISKELGNQTYVEVVGNGDTITYTGTVEQTINPFVSLSGEVTSTWIYNPNNDLWEVDSSQIVDDFQYDLKNIEGVWKNSNGDDEIIISNVTDTGFDIESVSLQTGMFHVEQAEDNSGMNIIGYRGTGGDISYFGGNTTSSENVAAVLSCEQNEINVSVSVRSGNTFYYAQAVIK